MIFEALGGQEQQKGNKMGHNGGDGRVLVAKAVLARMIFSTSSALAAARSATLSTPESKSILALAPSTEASLHRSVSSL